MKHLALILPTLVCASNLHAEGPEATTVRSITTAPAGLTDAGVLELELGGSQSYGKDATREGDLRAQLNLGLSSWLDLRIGWTGRAWWRAGRQGEEGVGDPYLGGQVLFVSQDKAGADIGLVYSHSLPRASVGKGLSTGYPEDTLLWAASRSMGRWAVDVNLGANRTRNPETRQMVNQKLGSVALTYAPAQGWNLTLDTYTVAKSDLGDRELGSILAASRKLSDRLKVDMSVERGWTDASPRFAFNAGLIYRIGKVWGN